MGISELAQKINSQQIEKIAINGDILEITQKDGVVATTKKEADTSLTETLRNYGVDPIALQGVNLEIQEESGFQFWAGILVPSLLPLIILIGFFWFLFRGAKGGQSQVMNFGKSNLKLSAPGVGSEKVTFKDVAGLKEIKQELLEVVDFLKNPKKFLDMGAKIPRGVLLMGAPGSGKTLLARAIAGESGVPFFYISASEFVEMFVGVGASRIRDAFATAKKHAPSILFVDEIDAVGRQRGAGMGGGHDEREQTLNQILVEMDGFDRENRVIVLAATNRPDILDTALLRAGRFDRQVVLDLPDIGEREAILKIHARNKPIEKDVEMRRVAVRTPGFSGADLENLLNEAAITAARHNKKIISQNDLFEAIEKVLLGPEKRSRIISDREKKITAYHEAGHALIATSLKDADPVHKISIIARGRAGGYTMKLPLEENRLKAKDQFLAELATLMGGYASEEVVFKEVTTGASNDLKEASSLSRRLVTKYGMSDKLGPVSFGDGEHIFLGRELTQEKPYSERVAAEIDGEVSVFIKQAYVLAKKIITSRRKVLDAIANALLEVETLEQGEFDKIIKPFNLEPLAVSAK
ncbi:MAG: cell division protein FtsH [Candidatus Harrisonbacteria bacterium CG10_big_fil_rev_8_21_14_0_10_45_28]|uniref:ATP-dependent zinc metalloprotease FtsH n=1 Tax=Candidatus Harrisonbacteria bacterium CG10_big_fil_rev_8_21_14_0_10_45_28 TaxID=1974586 RepID=A0A2H0UN66_9BACT|nr:MAG: cell division protein FtsH [Candidatus Harrisonbacteria bacterium CG10_big_fil_rev_8_21_14_0_10_45_28]